MHPQAPTRKNLKRWQLIAASLLLIGVIGSGYFTTARAIDMFQNPGTVDTAGGNRPTQVTVDSPDLSQPIDKIITTYFNNLGIILLIPVVFIVLAGLRYMAARNDAKKVTEAKQTIINLVLGTAILIGGFTVVAAIAALIMGLASGV